MGAARVSGRRAAPTQRGEAKVCSWWQGKGKGGGANEWAQSGENANQVSIACRVASPNRRQALGASGVELWAIFFPNILHFAFHKRRN